jgi:hypothetical protein
MQCTATVRVSNGKDNEGKALYCHKLCKRGGSEIEVGGTLTTAKAILCAKHAARAKASAFVSERGYPLGKVEKDDQGRPKVSQTQIKPLF